MCENERERTRDHRGQSSPHPDGGRVSCPRGACGGPCPPRTGGVGAGRRQGHRVDIVVVVVVVVVLLLLLLLLALLLEIVFCCSFWLAVFL